MNTRQYQRRSGCRWILWTIPLIVVCCLGGLLLAPAVPGLALRLLGFQPEGSVNEFWEALPQATPFIAVPAPVVPAALPTEESTPENSQPTAVMPTATAVRIAAAGGQGAGQESYRSWFQAVNVPPVITVDAGTGAMTVDSTTLYAQEMWFGRAHDGLPLGIIRYQEDALDAICEVWLDGCAADGYRIERVEFGPGGMVLYGTADVGGLRQEAGVILVLGTDTRSLRAAGLVLAGQVYAVPADGEIAALIEEGEALANTALRDLRVQAGSYDLGLAQITFAEGSVAFFLR